MKTLVLLLALAAHCGADPWKTLWLNYRDYFVMPTKLDDMKTGQEKYGQYVLMAHDDELNVDLYSFKDDPRVSVMIDTHGNIGGLRISFIKELYRMKGLEKKLTLPESVYDKPMYEDSTYWNMKVWYSDILFVNPEKLKAGGREGSPELVAEDLFLKPNGKWFKVPKDECDIMKNDDWTKQTCVPTMGMHYIFNSSADQTCEDFQPLNLMYDYGSLQAVQIFPYGTRSDAEGGRAWYDPVLDGTRSKKWFPNTPDCLKSWIDDYDVCSLHIYLNTKHPKTITCDDKSQDPNRCKQA